MEAVAVNGQVDPAFWQGKRVFLTGHTGFKGTWLTLMLQGMGAQVHGFALAPAGNPVMYELCSPFVGVHSVIGDIRDPAAVANAVDAANPDIAIHMAAQPLVRQSYLTPVETFATNVMGTINVLEALRTAPQLRAILCVTTDKVYRQNGEDRPFDEADPLGGHDPYAASKAACEIAIESYAASFFASRDIRLASARAGNVIGGGDFSADRIVPDIVRSRLANQPVVLRHPHATRPWQHVLDCLTGYLLFVEALAGAQNTPSALNFGPDGVPMSVVSVVEAMFGAFGEPANWRHDQGPHPKEAATLALATTRARQCLLWHDRLSTVQAIAATAEWYAALKGGANMRDVTLAQIKAHQAVKSG